MNSINYKVESDSDCFKKKKTKHDPVRAPSHYRQLPGRIECIAVTQHFNFNRGNAIKYIWRAEHKGKEEQDLEKAKQYIEFEIDRIRELKTNTGVEQE